MNASGTTKERFHDAGRLAPNRTPATVEPWMVTHSGTAVPR